MDNRVSVAVVTGASSGIGNACATFLAKKGTRVYGTCRDPGSYSRKADEFFEMLPMDLRDGISVAKVAEKVYSAEGKVDSLICCAGSGFVGAVEDSSVEEAQSVMNVNYLGTLRTIKAFLPRMREAGRGRILILGAIEGIVATPYQGFYSASEFALEGLAEALRIEVASFGIEVGLVELGSFRTAYGQSRLLSAGASDTSAYRQKLEAALGVLARDENSGSEPLVAARAVYAALSARRLPARTSAGAWSRRALARSRRWLPSSVFERIMQKLYRVS
jgi:short-subunit dehydrogenase